ncbi:unnamed protein product [Rotaria sp. Silwood2]|nr:unnamed protein product [Rotaria sp. Silwood2]CAF2736776.1 unnamed protein product [Rotaria sp. Silwood2]CAF3129636.1 unnamed protein product [Rotaria sp. Silwood2]CAF3968421.1 unnamed protein product [Rotaria sp. Silwood2]CAF4302132.1 unnamed protein product [Rotaria sp. Silwood2]
MNTTKYYVFIVGNGYVGLSLSTQSHIQLISDPGTPFISSGYSPIIKISSKAWEDSSSTIIQMNQGLVKRLQCFKISEERSAYVTHMLYAHRRRPSLIIQDIDIINPSDQTLDLDFQQKIQTSGNDIKQLDTQEFSIDPSKDTYLMTTYQMKARQHNSIIFVIITNKINPSTHIKPDRQSKQTILTVVKYSPLIQLDSLLNKTYSTQWQNTLQKQAKDDLSEALSISFNKLLKEHIDTWSSIWQSGFSISRSLAPSVMNGDIINRTIYYVLCSTSSPLYDLNLSETKKNEFSQSLFQIDRCYESHSTLIGGQLWRSPGDDLAVYQLSNLWRSTLLKQGCSTLMLSGVNGILQSMLLSIGGIRFRNHHLEMNLDPNELHRDMFFRLIHFGKQYLLNISITVGHDNRAIIEVSIDNDNGQAYACDAGCLDTPKKLSTKFVQFPVKMTSPSTAILYVTEDFEYMTQLQHTLHIKKIEIAPPHAHDILALHRHGHKLGGLPVIFWIALAFLIIIFHLFLLKIVLNEMGFFKPTISTYTRPRVH